MQVNLKENGAHKFLAVEFWIFERIYFSLLDGSSIFLLEIILFVPFSVVWGYLK